MRFHHVHPLCRRNAYRMAEGRRHDMKHIIAPLLPAKILARAVLDVVVDDEVPLLVSEAVVTRQHLVDFVYDRLGELYFERLRLSSTSLLLPPQRCFSG